MIGTHVMEIEAVITGLPEERGAADAGKSGEKAKGLWLLSLFPV